MIAALASRNPSSRIYSPASLLLSSLSTASLLYCLTLPSELPHSIALWAEELASGSQGSKVAGVREGDWERESERERKRMS